MDGKDMHYQNQNSAYMYVPAFRRLFCAMRGADLNQSESDEYWHHTCDSCMLEVFGVSPKRDFAHFYLAFGSVLIARCDRSQNRS